MTDRRALLASLTSGIVLVGCAGSSHSATAGGHDNGDKGERGEQEVTPVEDLMREHGVLRRIMYLYDEAALRFDRNADIPLDALGSAAAMVRHVIEDYHEKLEEELLFPRFEKAGKLADLTATLRNQHAAGRALTDQITKLSAAKPADADRATLATVLRRFNHMYRAHAAREDTVLFPGLRALVGKHAYHELGEQFENKETQMLGPHGFEHAVADVAKLEQVFGVDQLAQL